MNLIYNNIIGSCFSPRKEKFFMDMQCKLMEDVSKKSGNRYYYIFIPTLQKKVFLEAVEIELLKAKGFIK